MRNLVEPELLTVEPCGTWTSNRWTFIWNLVEPELLAVESLCGTLWNLNFEQWNLDVEPGELLTVEPLCGTLWNLNF